MIDNKKENSIEEIFEERCWAVTQKRWLYVDYESALKKGLKLWN